MSTDPPQADPRMKIIGDWLDEGSESGHMEFAELLRRLDATRNVSGAVAQEYFEASLPLLNGYPLTDSEGRRAWERLREANVALRTALGIESR